VLRLLLDEHVSPRVARGLRAKRPAIRVVTMQEWEGGAHLSERDELLLSAAREQRLTLVTYDRRTIAPLLKAWGEQGIPHGGVIFVDERTVSPSDIRGLVNALGQLWKAQHTMDWLDRVVYLTRAAR